MNRLAALLCCAVLPLAAWAQEPPGRVARLSFVEGEAAVFADAEQGWEAARVNSHLTSENSVWTEPGSRAEVRFGTKALRLGETTQLDILRLDDDAFHAHLVRGALAVRIRETDGGESFLVTTPEARFQLRGNGRYRIETDPDRGESRLVVFSGTARLEVAGGYISVDTSRGVRVTGGERPRYEFEPAWATPLDEWALARDQRWDERESARYVPHEMTGWEDLDDYGVWRNEPEYGPVWFPTRIAVGWAPYRLRPLVLGPPLGLGLGGRCALGLRAVPLRPLGARRQPLGLVSRAATSRVPSGRRRSWAGWAGRAGACRCPPRPPMSWAGTRFPHTRPSSRGTRQTSPTSTG